MALSGEEFGEAIRTGDLEAIAAQIALGQERLGILRRLVEAAKVSQ